MFNESYYIFSVGNVKPIWQEQYPSCWKVRAWQAVCRCQPTPVARLALPVCTASDACTCQLMTSVHLQRCHVQTLGRCKGRRSPHTGFPCSGVQVPGSTCKRRLVAAGWG